MTVGVLCLELFIHDANSLKEKRMALHSLKARLRNNYNVAVSQIDGEDKWQRTTLAVVGVERDRSCVNSTLSEVVNFVERSGRVHLIDYTLELL